MMAFRGVLVFCPVSAMRVRASRLGPPLPPSQAPRRPSLPIDRDRTLVVGVAAAALATRTGGSRPPAPLA